MNYQCGRRAREFAGNRAPYDIVDLIHFWIYTDDNDDT